MDVLAICGSPRKNMTTNSVLNAVLDGAGRPYEMLWPAYMKIGHCIGCLKCKNSTPGKCWQDDDMTEALEKMYDAKALIVASPTYFGNMPGPLKNFFDRSIPTNYTGKGAEFEGPKDHGTRPFKDRPAMILCVSGGGDHKYTAANLRLILNYYTFRIVAEFAEGMAGAVVTKNDFPEIYNELFALGKKLGDELK